MEKMKITAKGLRGENGCYSNTGEYTITFEGKVYVDVYRTKRKEVHFTVKNVAVNEDAEDLWARALHALQEVEYATSGCFDISTAKNICIRKPD